MRTEYIKWDDFINRVEPGKSKVSAGVIGGAAIYLSAAPSKFALAAPVANDSWAQIWSSALHIADWLCVGVITFAGVTWMFGNRSRALEMLIGASSGYLIIRHAMDIKEWLASI